MAIKITSYPKPCAAEKVSFAREQHHKTFALTLASERRSPATVESLTPDGLAPFGPLSHVMPISRRE